MWLVGFKHVFGKNYIWNLGVAKSMYEIPVVFENVVVVTIVFQSVFYL